MAMDPGTIRNEIIRVDALYQLDEQSATQEFDACQAEYDDSCESSGVSASSAASVVSIGCDDAIRKLEEELKKTREALMEKEERCVKLSSMQTHVDTEVHELTEAYKMVNLAEERRERSERLLNESLMKVDVLQAEVEALKILVDTPGAGGQHHANSAKPPGVFSKLLTSWVGRTLGSSTPKPLETAAPAPASTPSRQTKKSWLNPPTNASKKSQSLPTPTKEPKRAEDSAAKCEDVEIDPLYYREFAEWRESGHPLRFPAPDTPSSSTFLNRIQREDIDPCMEFDNVELAASVLTAIRDNTIEIERVIEDKPAVKNCALTAVPRFCPYRVRTANDDSWHLVSQLARNRIAAVCDFHTFLRYVSLGIVHASVRDTYFDVVALRRNMALARLGLAFDHPRHFS